MTQIEKSRDLVQKCFTASEDDLKPLFEQAFKISRENFTNNIAFHIPGLVHYETDFYEATSKYRFPSFSITGTGCSLNCEHCKGRLLESMISTTTPELLWKQMEAIHENGGKGCLVSGGSTPRGDTPLLQYIPTIKRAKEDLGLDIVVHTGIVYPEIADALADANIDGAMFDIIGSNKTLRQVYHLDMDVSIFEDSMTLLEERGIPMMPHIIVGLQYGKLDGEQKAIEMIRGHNPDSVIIVVLQPLDDTPMEDVEPTSPLDIARVILATRLAIQDKPVILGCARPLGQHRRIADRLAIDAGVNGIAYPTEEGYYYAEERGLTPIMSDECCSLLDRAIAKSSSGDQ